MAEQLRQTWDLEAIFEGGSRSVTLVGYLESLEAAIKNLRVRVEIIHIPDDSAAIDNWCALVDSVQQLDKQFAQARSFIGCLTAQDVRDQQAKLLEGGIYQTAADMESVLNLLEARILEIPEEIWEALVSDPRLQPVAFVLRERRKRAADKLSPAEEMLATDLSVDGYHAWGSLYSAIVGRMTIPWEDDGNVKQLSVGQAFNKFATPDNAVRAHLFAKWESAWSQQAELIAPALNHVGGFRLNLYRHRNWDSVLKEPLELNRMTESTLWAMWDAVNTSKSKLVAFLSRKAELLGKQRLDWCDLEAPIGKATKKIGYDEAAQFIVDQFRRFSPQMADFAARAFSQSWIEVEDRAGKAPGGFCTDFPGSCQTRIFMTYGGDAGSVSTLAHELGHAFHSDVMFDLPPLAQRYAMNVAETASTFAELITVNAAIKHASSPEERLALLDDKIGTSTAYLMNIHARFIFERRFYEARRKGPLSIEELNAMMETAQREAYENGLGAYHPLFWASKGHFYSTDVPFYNFPYTFGYLFSAGLYARAMEEGPGFEHKYVELLRDTGRTTVEDLARKHLGADLTRTEFWLTGVKLVLNDVEEYLRLTERA